MQRCNPSDLGCHDDTPWIWLPEQGSSPGLALDTKPVEDMPLATPLPGSFPSPLDRKWWSSSKTGSKRKDGLASHWPVSLGIMKTFFFLFPEPTDGGADGWLAKMLEGSCIRLARQTSANRVKTCAVIPLRVRTQADARRDESQQKTSRWLSRAGGAASAKRL